MRCRKFVEGTDTPVPLGKDNLTATELVAAWLGHTDVSFTLRTYVHAQPEHGTVIPEGAGCVKRLLSSGFAGFRPPCRQHWVRAGVKTERPQRSEDERS